MAPKRKAAYQKRSNQFDQPVEFHTARSVNFYTEREKTYQAALTFRDEEPLVGIQRLWFDPKSNEWKFSKKGVLMNVEAWKELVKKVDEINETFEPVLDHLPFSAAKKEKRPPAPEVGTTSSSTSTSEKGK